MTLGHKDAAIALAGFHAGRPTMEQPAALARQLHALAAAWFTEDPAMALATEIIENLFGGPRVDLAALPPPDRIFAENLLRLKPAIAAFGVLPPGGNATIQTGKDEDCIADSINEWSVFRLLNLALMASIPPRQKIAIVTSVRNEGLGMLEWLAHHRASGIHDFFVYTNDNTDGSDELLRVLAGHGIIRLIENHVGQGVKIQTKILEHSLHLLPELRDFEWVFYIDVDEFFISRCEPGLNLDSFFAEFFRTFPAEQPSAICFNWKWFGSENAYGMTEGFLLERFVHSIHNEHVKSLVRLKDVVSMHRVHVPVLLEHAWLVNSDFMRVDPAPQMKPSYGKAQLNHYWNKSFQEFVLKRQRGRISRGLGGEPLDYSSFFDWGANGKRGNFDPPPAKILDQAKQEFEMLARNFGLKEKQQAIKANLLRSLDELNEEINIAGIYEARGQNS